MKLSKYIRKYCFLIVVLIGFVTVGSGFAIVWMQQQISRTADRTKRLESEFTEMVRKIDFLDERIARIHQPVVLQGEVAGRLRPSLENQLVWVQEREMPNGRVYAVAQPYEVSLDLAMVRAAGSR